MLDPHSHLPDVADAFARIFAGGRVAIADLPCGAGAASLAILTTLGELRSQAVVPREPLDIVLIGGDFSNRAREHAANAFARVKSILKSQAIFVEESFHPWNVLEPLSNTDLIQELTVRSQNCGARMLVLANFSDFLHRENKWSAATRQLEELFRHSRSARSSVIWIEPGWNQANPECGGFFKRVGNWVSTWIRSFVRTFPEYSEPGDVGCSSASVVHPLSTNKRFRVTLAVKRFDLVRCP
jgi:3',5'-cyclic AMP phosphodiesterase CpdA